MEIRRVRASEIEDVRQILVSEPRWDHRFRDPVEFGLLVERSQMALVAVEGGRIIGFARALTDGISNGYLALLIVERNHRGKGVGRALVDAVVGDNPRVTWVLRTDPGARVFYERIGFDRSSAAMERPRQQSIDA
jgi:predicted N-acetyltransferase YhbS